MQLLVRLYSSANVHLSMLSYVFQIEIKIKSSFCSYISYIPKKMVSLIVHDHESLPRSKALNFEFFSSTLFLTRNISYYGQSILSTEKIICENFMYFMHHWYGLVISISYTVAAHVQNLWIGNSKAGRISKLSEEPKNCLKNNTHIFIRRSSKIIRT